MTGHTARCRVAAFAILGFSCARLMAGTVYWDGSSSSSWTALANWSTVLGGGASPAALPGSGDDVVLNADGPIAHQLATLSPSCAAQSLRFRSVATVPITLEASQTLTIGTGGITVESGSAAHAINASIALNGSQSWTNDSPNALTIGGAVAGGGHALSITGSGTTTINGALDSGIMDVTKNGSGTLNLNGHSSYGGPTRINGGTVTVSADSNLGTSGVVLNGGTLRIAGGAPFSSSKAITLDAGGGWIQVDSSAGATLSGVVSGPRSLIKTGAGVLALTGNNNYAGGTMISEGVLQASHGAGLPATSNLVLNGGVLQSSGTFTRSRGSRSSQMQWTANGGGFAAQGGKLTVNLGGAGGELAWSIPSEGIAGTLRLGSLTADSQMELTNPIDLRGANRTVEVADNPASSGDFATLSGNLRTSTGIAGLIKTGPGTLVLSGANTYTGVTRIDGGVLSLSSSGALGGNGSIVFGGGVLRYGAGNTVDYSPRFRAEDDTAYKVDTNGQNVTWAGNLTSPAGTLTKSGGGILVLSGNNSYAGGTTVLDGAVRIAAAHALPAGGSLSIGAGGMVVLGNGLSSPLAVSAAASRGATAVPEPGTLVLLVGAAVALLAARCGVSAGHALFSLVPRRPRGEGC